MRPRFGPRKPHRVPGVRPATSIRPPLFVAPTGRLVVCRQPPNGSVTGRWQAGKGRDGAAIRRHSLWGCLLRRLGMDPDSPLALTALSLGLFSGWRPARESLTAMEPKPPVPVSSTECDYRRTESESQTVSRQSPPDTLALERTESSPIRKGERALFPRYSASLWQRTVMK